MFRNQHDNAYKRLPAKKRPTANHSVKAATQSRKSVGKEIDKRIPLERYLVSSSKFSSPDRNKHVDIIGTLI